MSKRFVIATMRAPLSSYYDIVHDFIALNTQQAAQAFRTLYGEQPQYVLFEQIACSEPAGSRDEADDTCWEDSVQQRLREQGL